MHVKLVDGCAEGDDLPRGFGGGLSREEANVERVLLDVDDVGREGLVPNDARELVGGTKKGRDGVAEAVLELGRDPLLQRIGVGRLRVEDHVATRDERLDIGEAHAREVLSQSVHLHGVAADVDGAEQRDVTGHRERRRM